MSTAEGLTVTVRTSLAGPVVEAAGEIDTDSAPQLRTALHRALAAGPPMIVVDLAEVTFCDSSGLNTLLQVRLDAERTGTVLHLGRPSDQVARLLEITGGDQIFAIDADVAAEVPAARAS